MVETRLLSPGEAARVLGIDVKTLERWADGGQVTTIRTPSGQRRYLAAETHLYAEFRAARRAKSAPDDKRR